MRIPKSAKFKNNIIYILSFLLICIYFYNYNTRMSYIPMKQITERANFSTFISSKYSESNGTLHLEGYFEGGAFGKISVIDITNLSFLSLWNKKSTVSYQERSEPITVSKKITGCPGFYPYHKVKINEVNEIEKKNLPDWRLFQQERTVENVNCRSLFDNNTLEQNKTLNNLLKHPYVEIPPSSYINISKDCEKYKQDRGYITSSLTEEEENFPIAYSILVFKSIQQVEMLLRSIYRPQNVYCIHCDTKADPNFKLALQGITSCFENVFISSRSFNVVWGTVGVLLPEIACMKDLWKHKKWKYFINLTGQEFPLRTNLELVKILKSYNGANDMESTVKRANKARWKDAPPPPHGITPVKGSVHVAVSRGFVEYILFDKIAKSYFNWTRSVEIPDEVFFSTLNHNPQLKIPGSYKGVPETDCDTKPFLTRFKNWGNHIYNWPCHGSRVRLVCVFGIGDLPLLASRPEMFANKFYLHYQPHALQCMDQLIYNRTRDEYFNVLKFDVSKYQSLEFIKHTV
ncbi:beta-1,3-galactosyl-O-glycosyl-glycoprotein beta-1,6-N-acetylglucosaminyltransferase-like [Mytilus edulis]|uniref:beta-1,3-galactosyl-O-glycosyl-glycoprotein beta-1,6-N-acetylglucosaminyltransferase-like n=1 Tax=Mytilus edulis TaxID=6550 RepID=UPI0039EEF70E